MRTRAHSNGLTLIELILAVFIVAVLVCLIILWQRRSRHEDGISSVLNNARQLYIAGFSMATDFNTTGDQHLGWPGDLAERKKDPVLTVSQYIDRLIAYEYLKKVDMQKVMLAPGVTAWEYQKELRRRAKLPLQGLPGEGERRSREHLLRYSQLYL
jgi:prepilin-type N-terminal cleavage/methylation domain-containing protein